MKEIFINIIVGILALGLCLMFFMVMLYAITSMIDDFKDELERRRFRRKYGP